MGSGTNAPVYDPSTVSAQQQGSNIQSAVSGQAASNVNQVTPYGTLTYQQTGVGPNGVPTYTATTNLSPAQQQLVNTLQGTQQTAGTQAGQLLTNANYGANGPPPVANLPTSLGNIPEVGSTLPTSLGAIPETSNLPQVTAASLPALGNIPEVGALPQVTAANMPSLPNLPTVSNLGDMTSGVTGQLLQKETGYLDPFFTQQTSQLDAKLRNQGLSPTDPAYQQAMNNLSQSQNQSVTGFLAQAEPAAFQQSLQTQLTPWEQALQQEQQQYGQALQTGSTQYGEALQTGTTQHDQALQDALARYGTALTSGTTQFGEALQAGSTLHDQALADAQAQYQTAVSTGTVSHDQALQDALARYNATLQTGTTQYGEQLQNYTLPLSLASQAISLSQPAALPSNLVSTPQAQVAPTNVVGAYNTAQQAAIQNAANQTAAQNALISGLFSIPSAVLGGYARSPAGSSKINTLFGGP